MNTVKQTVFDYMHLVCLGLLMEKILLAIIDGKHASCAKLSPASIKALSNRLELIKQFCLKEFARQPINIAKLYNIASFFRRISTNFAIYWSCSFL